MIEHVLFDQFQRYNNVKLVVDKLRNNSKLKILEVGANEHQNLERFLPSDEITYLDLSLPEHLRNHPKYIEGDATQMEFNDDSFDVVVALDVYEHIPVERRQMFVQELNRVSSEFFIITAPFHSAHVESAEIRTNAVYKSLFHTDFIWLDEHRENGLPDFEELVSHLSVLKVDHAFLSHGDVNVWEKIMNMHFFAAKKGETSLYRSEIDTFYNRYIFPNDYTENSYRKIVVGSKKNNVDHIESIANTEKDYDAIKKLNELESIFYQLFNTLDQTEIPVSTKEYAHDDFAQVFFDYGKGFSEEYSIVLSHTEQQSRFYSVNNELDKEIKSVRIDPSNYKGIFKLRNICINHGNEISFYVSGNYIDKLDDVYLFDKDDPNLVIEFEKGIELKSISFELNILISDVSYLIEVLHQREKYYEAQQLQNEVLNEMNKDLDSKIQGLSKDINELVQEVEKLKECIEHKNDEVNSLQYSNQEQEALLNSIYQSRSWKIISRVKGMLKK
ncbi:class I SAM-dependent methyltransferase [Paenibacillus terrigena]|uniref:class I SAM-dependent methyltransferase n=1 Tax=Paenibacillus terrigena TaxID=369333 RepID=UPI000363EA20|nr:class I SAM-dependent methyltransferase [Paenibacillus terrigena]